MCTTSSGETPVSFAWLKDGQILTAQLAQSRRILIKPDQDSSTLKISSVRLDHAGNYTCLAKNRFGSQLHSAQLVVHGEPRWLKEPQLEPIVATRGQSVVIDCQTTGWPRPQQTWQIKSEYQSLWNKSSRVVIPTLWLWYGLNRNRAGERNNDDNRLPLRPNERQRPTSVGSDSGHVNLWRGRSSMSCI